MNDSPPYGIYRARGLVFFRPGAAEFWCGNENAFRPGAPYDVNVSGANTEQGAYDVYCARTLGNTANLGTSGVPDLIRHQAYPSWQDAERAKLLEAAATPAGARRAVAEFVRGVPA